LLGEADVLYDAGVLRPLLAGTHDTTVSAYLAAFFASMGSARRFAGEIEAMNVSVRQTDVELYAIA
jgi:hypothetical protein